MPDAVDGTGLATFTYSGTDARKDLISGVIDLTDPVLDITTDDATGVWYDGYVDIFGHLEEERFNKQGKPIGSAKSHTIWGEIWDAATYDHETPSQLTIDYHLVGDQGTTCTFSLPVGDVRRKSLGQV